jgi:hypothetical protein
MGIKVSGDTSLFDVHCHQIHHPSALSCGIMLMLLCFCVLNVGVTVVNSDIGSLQRLKYSFHRCCGMCEMKLFPLTELCELICI